MLYVTTRNNRETYTVSHTLKNDRGPDGGQFVPFHSPVFSQEEVAALLHLPFAQCVANVMNRLLGLKLTGWDITFYAGKHPVRIQNLGYRMMVAEGWHNPDWHFDRLVQIFAGATDSGCRGVSQWMGIAARIAVFAGICSECIRSGIAQKVDLALISGDFSGPMAAWYARRWGFPIGNIICCCNENGSLWDLFANGQMRTDGVSLPTNTPDADVVLPDGLEQLVYACGGTEEVVRYNDACRQGKIYIPSDVVLAKLRDGTYVCVVGNQRMLETIPRAYTSRNYLLSPYDALCYCGVSDYRARFGETGTVLIFSEKSPVRDADTVCSALGIPVEDLKKYL